MNKPDVHRSDAPRPRPPSRPLLPGINYLVLRRGDGAIFAYPKDRAAATRTMLRMGASRRG